MSEVVLAPRFPELLVDAKDPMMILKGDDVIDCNQAALEFFKFSDRQQCFTTSIWQVSPMYQPDGNLSQEQGWQKILYCYQFGQQRFSWLFQSMDNELLWAEITIVKIMRADQSYIHATLRNLVKEQPTRDDKLKETHGNSHSLGKSSYQEQLDIINPYVQLLHEHKKVIDASSIVSKTTPQGVITYVNDNFCKTSGYLAQELIGQSHSIIRHPRNGYRSIWRTMENDFKWSNMARSDQKSQEKWGNLCGKKYNCANFR